MIGEQLAKKLGQAVVVDNKPGAGGSVGGTNVVQSPADGYTLMLRTRRHLDRPVVLEKQPYDPIADFTHIASIGSAPRRDGQPGGRHQHIVDLENAAKKSGGLQFGSGGPASIGHIYGEMMSRALGVKMTHVPYRGGAPMTTDLISGVIPVGIDVITAFVPFFKNGQIKPLAVTSAQRSALAPEVPTVAESGHARIVLDNFFGLTGPAKVPPDIVARLNAATNEVLAQPEIVKRLLDLGVTDHPGHAGPVHGLRAQPGRHAAAGGEGRAGHALRGMEMAEPLTLERLNAADGAGFVALLDGIYEHSPWVAERAAPRRPFATLAQLKFALVGDASPRRATTSAWRCCAPIRSWPARP